jgi:hypothetical protein
MRFKQKSDFEILAHRFEMWSSKDKYSSNNTPNNLKLFSIPSLWILSIFDMRFGSSGWPGSLLLKVSTQSLALILLP